MFCGNCGDAEQDGRFCSKCGYQNKGEKIQTSSASRKHFAQSETTDTPKFTGWSIASVVSGILLIFTGMGILFDPNCNTVLPAQGGRFVLVLSCSSEGQGGQFVGLLLAIAGVALIAWSLRVLFPSNKDG